jgi:putative SOS response-associated peptidase YedK
VGCQSREGLAYLTMATPDGKTEVEPIHDKRLYVIESES